MKKRLYSIHSAMKQRCHNPNDPNYYRYGGRGITVFEFWDKYKNFKTWALSSGYKDNLTIDRIDNDKGYEPDNCRWVNMTVQKFNCGSYKNKKGSHKGIVERKGKYRALIWYKRKQISLGTYENIEDAILAREKAEKYYLNLELQKCGA